MEDYKPNSHRFKEEKKSQGEREKVTKVIKGTAKTKKKNEFRKFTDIFISEDVGSVKSYILMDVVVPVVKEAIADTIDVILFGNTKRGKKRSGVSDYVSYRSYSDSRREDRFAGESHRTRSGYSFDDVVVDTRGEAEDVISRMDELMDEYGLVRVADLYDLVGISCNYTDNNYGWTNIRNARAVRVRNGYLIEMPKALPIK